MIRESPPVEGAPATYTTPLIIILTAFGTIDKAMEAMQLGAFDFLTKPYTVDHLTVVINKGLSTLSLHHQVGVLKKEVGSHYDQLVGTNPRVAAQLAVAKQVAPSNVTVLLQGETGTGKEVVARAIHQWSTRRSKPFIAVNCAALPEHLLENELFGHERGGFALGDRLIGVPGKIEAAEGGTVFLDEIGDMPLPLQENMIQLLRDQTFCRIAGTQKVQANVRFIAATSRDLRQAIRQGTFREDLFSRLATITITLPPLRDRPEDIPALAELFLRRYAITAQRPPMRLTPAALEALTHYRWPGNVRELENVITRAAILASGDEIGPQHLSLPLGNL